MIHTNDDIADLIQDTIQLMQEIDTFVNTESDHDCTYRTIFRTHRLMVTSFLEKLNDLTNEKAWGPPNDMPIDILNKVSILQVAEKGDYVPDTGVQMADDIFYVQV